MKNIDTLKNTSQFKKVYDNGRSFANRLLVLYVLRGEEGKKLGISVSKKVGNSVVRHRTARLIRESYRSLKEKLPEDCWYVAVARYAAAGKGQKEINEAMLHLCRLHKLFREEAGQENRAFLAGKDQKAERKDSENG